MKRIGSLVVVLMLAACSGENEGTEDQEAVNSEENTQEVEDDEVADQETDIAEEKASTESEATEENEEVEQVEEEPTESETETEVEENNGEVAETPEFTAHEFSEEEKQAMNDEFYNWAVERAEIGGMAVTPFFFTHGAAGSGDWYANTPDGEAQVQDFNNPGFDHFDMHIIGGVAFYQPSSGIVGTDDLDRVPGTAEGYSNIAVPETNIHKYILVDNGVVYELIAPKENMAFSAGFGEYADDGTKDGGIPTDKDFEVSGDQEAQNEWQKILWEYQ
ncbi:hypothetical protein LNK15_08335 [Jeotgalicoccus huakuii]|nr:hypothetical protein [Jeotgalicoccus huakuii]